MGSSWYPGDDWRGDVARIIMYANLRYNEPFTDVGTLNLFLEWNEEDPVSSIEDQRNTVISGAQGNRNPFVDNPYIATVIWGGTPAENRWTSLSVTDRNALKSRFYPNPVSDNYLHFESINSIEVKIYDILGKLVKKEYLDHNLSSIDISGLNKGVYLVRMSAGSQSFTKKLIRQ